MNNVYRIYDMGYKEVISLEDGARLGYVSDVEIDIGSGRVLALVIPGRLKLLGLLGREEDYIVPWSAVETVGEDLILVAAARGRLRRGRTSRENRLPEEV